MLEISGFEAIAAEHGRGRGNAMLRDLVQRLGMEIRRSDTLGRYGGQEFLVLLPDTGVEGAVQVAERLIWSVRRHRLLDWSSGPREPRPADGNGLTAAVGIAVLPRDGAHAALLLRAADRALTEAKQAGGDCWRGASGIPPQDPCREDGASPQDPPRDRPWRGEESPAEAAAVREPPANPGNLSPCDGGETLAPAVLPDTPTAVAAGRDLHS